MTDRWQVASRANVPPFHVMDLLAAATRRQRSHGDLLNLLAGQPSTGAPAPVLTTSLYARFSSRGEADFGDRVLSAMRWGFGGHVEKKA